MTTRFKICWRVTSLYEHSKLYGKSESMKLLIEDQASSPSFDLSPPPPPPPSPVSKLDQRRTGRLRKRVSLPSGGGRGRGLGRSHIARWREISVLYKSLNTHRRKVFCKNYIAHPTLDTIREVSEHVLGQIF